MFSTIPYDLCYKSIGNFFGGGVVIAVFVQLEKYPAQG